MTVNEKGRFCGSCAKTVVDFTKKSTEEIQDYFTKNQGKLVCGHFRRKQLDSIVIQIPEEVFHKQLSFQKLFILALLLVMGTTLFSCKIDQGKPQKIEKIEVIDTIIKVEKVIENTSANIDTTNILKPVPPPPIPPIINFPPPLTGLPAIEHIDGDIEIEEVVAYKEIEILEEVLEMGEPIAVGGIQFRENKFFPANLVEIPPRFKGTGLKNKEKLKNIFDKKLNRFIDKNLDKDIGEGLGLSKGKHKIFIQFTIDEKGNISDLKVKAPHPKMEKTLTTVMQDLPQFIPAKHHEKKVAVRYTLPIVFSVE